MEIVWQQRTPLPARRLIVETALIEHEEPRVGVLCRGMRERCGYSPLRYARSRVLAATLVDQPRALRPARDRRSGQLALPLLYFRHPLAALAQLERRHAALVALVERGACADERGDPCTVKDQRLRALMEQLDGGDDAPDAQTDGGPARTDAGVAV